MRKAFQGKAFRNRSWKMPKCSIGSEAKSCDRREFREEIAQIRAGAGQGGLAALAAAAASTKRRLQPTAVRANHRQWIRRQRQRWQLQTTSRSEQQRLELSDLFADRWPRAAGVPGELRRRDARHAARGAGRSHRDLEVEIDVLSRDAVKIHPGDPVLLEHWGGDAPLNGRVRVVEPSGFTKISTLGVEEQRVWVIVDFVDPPEKRHTLGDGFRVEARIVIDEAHDVLKIPTSALFRAGDRSGRVPGREWRRRTSRR